MFDDSHDHDGGDDDYNDGKGRDKGETEAHIDKGMKERYLRLEASSLTMYQDKQRSARKKRLEGEPEGAEASSSGGDHGWTPTWFRKEEDPNTGIPIHVYTEKYWRCKANQDWSPCPDIF